MDLITLFLTGVFGGVHCIGMCGGIVVAMCVGRGTAANGGVNRGINGSVNRGINGSVNRGVNNGVNRATLLLHLAYNLGRITAYVLAAVVLHVLLHSLLPDTSSAGAEALAFRYKVTLILGIIANLLLICMGLYLLGKAWLLRPLERIGLPLWRLIEPYGRRFLPIRTVWQAYPVGLIWGFLPCGLVYGALVYAISIPSLTGAAAAMLAFGLGTLPNLLLAAFALQRCQRLLQKNWIRIAAGSGLIALGIYRCGQLIVNWFPISHYH